MHEIICPHYGKAFTIDAAGYADIRKQVRDSEFEQQLHERLELAEQDKRNAVALAETKMPGIPLKPYGSGELCSAKIIFRLMGEIMDTAGGSHRRFGLARYRTDSVGAITRWE